MESLQEFIRKYFSILNISKMPPAVLNRYKAYAEKDDFPNDTVKSWGKNFMKHGSTDWQDLPDIKALPDKVLDLLYKDLLRTFTAMHAHKMSLSDKGKTFVETYYGPGADKIFFTPEISLSDETQIKKLLDYINKGDINVGLEWGEPEVIQEILEETRSVSGNSSKRVISNIVNKIISDETSKAEAQALGINLNKIRNAVEPTINITNDDRKKLRDNFGNICSTLLKEKKTYEDFKKYEPNEKIVSEQIDTAISNTDYTGKTNKANFVPPKYKDTDPNLKQRIDKGFENFYTNFLKQYATAHRDNIFIKPEAKAIFKAIDKAKITPTDDLNKLIKESGTIINSLRGKEPFKAADHMEWLSKQLESFKQNGLSDSVDGALRWGYQMNRIVTELCKNAVAEGKEKEAKTALEVLSVMQYGTFTSRTMDAINKTDINIFSDSKLSWNNNEGVQMVTKALDKTIGFGIKVAGYAITGAVNRARKHGAAFNHSGEMQDLSDARDKELADKKIKDEKDKNAADKANRLEKRDNNKTIKDVKEYIKAKYNGLDIRHAQEEVQEQEKEIQEQVAIANAARKEIEEMRSAHDEFEKQNKIVNDFDNIPNDIKSERKKLKKIKSEIAKRQKILSSKGPYETHNNPITHIAMSEAESEHYEDKLNNEIDNLTRQFQSTQSEIDGLKAKFKNPEELKKRNDAEVARDSKKAENDKYLKAQQDLENAQKTYQHLETNARYVDLRDNLEKYSEAKEAKEKAEKEIETRQQEWNKWDEKNRNIYKELMAYWDFLQSGGKTKAPLFRLSTKKIQEKMDKTQASGKTAMEEAYLSWKQQHSYI